MSQTKEERIASLRQGIESEATPEHIKEQMREMLAELEAPEPPPAPKPKPKPAPQAPPPPPPKRVFSEGEKEILREEYKNRLLRKKSKQI